MNIYAWSSLITFVSVFFIGIGVFLHKPRGKVNRQFALFSTGIAIWAAGRVLYLTASEYETALYWAHFTLAGTVFIPPLFLHFISAFLRIRVSKSLLFAYLASFFLFVFSFTPWIVKGMTVYLLTLIATVIPFFLLTVFFQAILPLKVANIATFFLFIAILFIFSNIKPLTQKWVERSLFRERYRHYQSIHEFSQSIVRFLHLEDLTEKFFTVLTKTLHPKSISIFLSDGRGNFRLHRTFGHEEGSIDVLLPPQHPLLSD